MPPGFPPLGNFGHVQFPEYAGGIIHLFWPVNTLGSPQEELESVAGERDVCVFFSSLSCYFHNPTSDKRKLMDGSVQGTLVIKPSCFVPFG